MYSETPRAKTQRDGESAVKSARMSSPSAPMPMEEPSLFVTPQIEALIGEWLSALGLPMNASRSPPLCDSFRNGVLACQLVGLLTKRQMDGVITAPSTASEVARNFEVAVKALAKSRPPAFNPAFYSLGGRLARGNDELLWGFYWGLYNAFPCVVPPHLEEVAVVLPYDSIAIRRLEEGLLSWLRWLGVAQQYGNPTSLLELIPHIRTGYLLCHTVAQALDFRISDVFPSPKSEGAVLTNVRKALEGLKRHPNMSQKFVWGKERDIIKGNLGVVMGLLEDICRCGDGLPARKPGAGYHADGPYVWTPSTVPVVPANFEPAPPLSDLQAPSEEPLPDIIPSPKFISSLLPHDSAPIAEATLPKFDFSLKNWLSSLGIIRYSESFFGGSRINELRDGVLFCEIIETVERKQLPGVEFCPKTAAACMQNIRRGLEFMRGKPSFPSELYYVEEELRRGDGKTWRKVLVEMQRVYKFAGRKEGSRKSRF